MTTPDPIARPSPGVTGPGLTGETGGWFGLADAPGSAGTAGPMLMGPGSPGIGTAALTMFAPNTTPIMITAHRIVVRIPVEPGGFGIGIGWVAGGPHAATTVPGMAPRVHPSPRPRWERPSLGPARRVPEPPRERPRRRVPARRVPARQLHLRWQGPQRERPA